MNTNPTYRVREGGIANGERDNLKERIAAYSVNANRDGDHPEQTGGHPIYKEVLAERVALHIEKSSGYGTGEDAFANFTAVAQMTGQPRYLYPVHRTIEKLTRVLSLHAQGRVDELEEEFKDCASLLDCAKACCARTPSCKVRLAAMGGSLPQSQGKASVLSSVWWPGRSSWVGAAGLFLCNGSGIAEGRASFLPSAKPKEEEMTEPTSRP